jgi:hypothetical protein
LSPTSPHFEEKFVCLRIPTSRPRQLFPCGSIRFPHHLLAALATNLRARQGLQPPATLTGEHHQRRPFDLLSHPYHLRQ